MLFCYIFIIIVLHLAFCIILSMKLKGILSNESYVYLLVHHGITKNNASISLFINTRYEMATAAQVTCYGSHYGKTQNFQKEYIILDSRNSEMTQHRAYVVSTPFSKLSPTVQCQKFCLSL